MRDDEHPRWRPHLMHWAMLMGGFWLIQIIFFTTFFTNTVNGWLPASSAAWATGWRSRASRGSQPVYYYVLIGWLYEFSPAILSIGGFATVFYNLVMSPGASVGCSSSSPSSEQPAPPPLRYHHYSLIASRTIMSWLVIVGRRGEDRRVAAGEDKHERRGKAARTLPADDSQVSLGLRRMSLSGPRK